MYRTLIAVLFGCFLFVGCSPESETAAEPTSAPAGGSDTTTDPGSEPPAEGGSDTKP